MNIRNKLFASLLAFGVVVLRTFANVPVVFLHGWEGSASNWNNMTNLLVQNGGYQAKDLHPIDYDAFGYSTPIQTYARRIDVNIRNWLYENGFYDGSSPVIDIVAHSMGGLIVRDIVANNLNEGSYGIRRVITLATPHYGQKQEAGHTAEQMKYGSRYLWDLAESWEFKNAKINSLLCVSGIYDGGLDDKLVDHWSAALSDCPVRYVNKVHMHLPGDYWDLNGPPIYACAETLKDPGNVADPVYLLVRNYLLYGNILSQSVLGVSLSGRRNRGGAVFFKVKDSQGNGIRYTKKFVKAVEPSTVVGVPHYGTEEVNNTNAGNANEIGVCEITSNIDSYKGLPEGSYRINFYESEADENGVKTPSFTSEPITIKNDRVTVCYITPTAQNASDIVFLIDSTGSMSGQISSAKSRAKSILSETLAKSPQSRFAVVEYRDFPTSPYGDSGDFTYKVRCKFTSNQATVISALDAIAVGGGGDSDESLYSALVACASGGDLGGWLNSNRSIITMTDAAPHDPEPYTGYTRASVASVLNSAGISSGGGSSGGTSSGSSGTSSGSGGIRVHAVVSSSSASLQSLYSGLCGDTGGMAVSTSSADEVGTLIHDLVQFSTASAEADWFVNVASGNDANSGKSWAAAKKSINALDGLLQSNDVVAVAAGIYGSITLTNDVPATFKNINDAATVIVDGCGTNRCVTVPSRSIVFNGFIFRNGSASGCGGGAWSGTYESCIFSNNRVHEYYQDGGTVVVEGKGGAAYDAQLKGCTVYGNTATGFGGGLYGCSVSESVVTGNVVNALTKAGRSVGGGGGIANSSVSRTFISDNFSEWRGGGALASAIENSLLARNTAVKAGGAAVDSGITNCTVVGNTSELGAGVYSSTVLNSIVWSNQSPSNGLANCGASTLAYSCTYPLAEGTGNISANPTFRTATNYLLAANSPCVDAGFVFDGLKDVDLKGEMRVYTNVVDMGAYEYCDAPPVPTNFIASAGTYFSGINLTWDDALAASSYSIWRSVTSNLTSATKIADVAAISYLDKDVDTGTVYYYWVNASNSGGESGFSDMATGAKAFFPPDDVTATDGTRADSIAVTWTAMPNAWYRVYRTDSMTNDFVAVSGWQTETLFIDNSVEENKFYYYAVMSAINSNGDGASSLSVVDKGWGTYTIEPPSFSPATKTVFFGQSQVVAISCATPAAEIRYTLDGSEPTIGSALYVGSLVVSNSVTVKAKAFVEGLSPSETVEAEYVRAAIVGANLVQNSSPGQGEPQTLSIPAPGTYRVSFDYTQGGDVELYMMRGGVTNRLAVVSAATAGSTNFLFDVAAAGEYELVACDVSSGVSHVTNLSVSIRETPDGEGIYWIYETEETYGLTGTWLVGNGFQNGKIPVDGTNTFTPYTQSDGRFVTVTSTAEFDSAYKEMPDFDCKVALNIYMTEEDVLVFKVLTMENGVHTWKTVGAEGLAEPMLNTPYTFRFRLDCTNRTYTVAIVDGNVEIPLTHGATNEFAFAGRMDTSLEQIGFDGTGNVMSLLGDYKNAAAEFMRGDVLQLVGGQCSQALTEGQATWLNSMKGYYAVKAKVATMGLADFNDAYLLNLDISQSEFGLGMLKVTGIEVTEDEVRIAVTLNRAGAIQVSRDGTSHDAPINGLLKLYGGETPSDRTLLNATVITDDSFSSGDTEVFTYPRSGSARFFCPAIVSP